MQITSVALPSQEDASLFGLRLSYEASEGEPAPEKDAEIVTTLKLQEGSPGVFGINGFSIQQVLVCLSTYLNTYAEPGEALANVQKQLDVLDYSFQNLPLKMLLTNAQAEAALQQMQLLQEEHVHGPDCNHGEVLPVGEVIPDSDDDLPVIEEDDSETEAEEDDATLADDLRAGADEVVAAPAVAETAPAQSAPAEQPSDTEGTL